VKRVAIQGIQGSNHYIVAQNYFEKEASIKECLSFDTLVHAVVSEECQYGIMALENTIAGSIIPNYALIDQNNLSITGEYYLNIHHHLMALENQKTEDIQEVYSHPMALLQCKEFFKQHPNIKLIEDVDTADVAKRISEQQLQHTAAIAPKIAADIFNLAVLEDEIQTITNNATRFVIVEKRDVSTALNMTKNTVTEALEVNTSTTQQINTGNEPVTLSSHTEPVEVLSKGLEAEANKSTHKHQQSVSKIRIRSQSRKFSSHVECNE
jgi:prephenate dehydratase